MAIETSEGGEALGTFAWPMMVRGGSMSWSWWLSFVPGLGQVAYLQVRHRSRFSDGLGVRAGHRDSMMAGVWIEGGQNASAHAHDLSCDSKH